MFVCPKAYRKEIEFLLKSNIVVREPDQNLAKIGPGVRSEVCIKRCPI